MEVREAKAQIRPEVNRSRDEMASSNHEEEEAEIVVKEGSRSEESLLSEEFGVVDSMLADGRDMGYVEFRRGGL